MTDCSCVVEWHGDPQACCASENTWATVQQSVGPGAAPSLRPSALGGSVALGKIVDLLSIHLFSCDMGHHPPAYRVIKFKQSAPLKAEEPGSVVTAHGLQVPQLPVLVTSRELG
jgi:hypothetical protein